MIYAVKNITGGKKRLITIKTKPATFIVFLFLVACSSENTEISVSIEGHETFNRIVNQEVALALSGSIKKEQGFDSNCSVHKETEDGIMITRGVCDKENSFNIRVTNSTDYPPSKKLKSVSINYGKTEIKLKIGEIKEITGHNNNTISVELNRTGASFFIEGKRPKQPNAK